MLSKTSIMFILFNFGITWGAWICVIFMNPDNATEPGNPAFLIYILGGLLGPVVAATLSKKLTASNQEFKLFLKQIVKVKIPITWYAVVLIIPFLLTFIPRFTNWFFTGTLNLSTAQPLYMVFVTLITFIIAGGLEEVGWRGVLLPELRKKTSSLIATFIIIPIWAVWHLPLWFINGTAQQGSSFISFLLGLAGLTLLLTIIYVKTQSIFLCVLFHGLSNSCLANIGDTSFGSDIAEWTANLVKLLFCFLLFGMFLKSDKRKITSQIFTSGASQR